MHHRRAAALLGGLLLSLLPSPLAAAGPVTREFVLTAYYSPLPGQCCYVKGSEAADKVLNGQGTHGADGTPVYPGMIAAPSAYAFGTRIDLSGLGVLTVHDRGGAIQVLDGDVHRIDVWAGHGEEGLARALAFGVRRVTGTVYPPGGAQPAEKFSLEDLSAPLEKLRPYMVSPGTIVGLRPALNHKSLSVSLLQENLAALGYFRHAVTGLFGEVTRESLAAFNRDMGLAEPDSELSDVSAAYLQAAAWRAEFEAPVPLVDPGEKGEDVLEAKRLLRSMGYYRGRTTDAYDQPLFDAILAFQKEVGLVGGADSPGAGRIGPKTREALARRWTAGRVSADAERILVARRVRTILADRGALIDVSLEEGATGGKVSLLQRLLADRGYLPTEKVTGTFGPLTKEAVLAYQKAVGLVASEADLGAGRVGPNTLASLRREQIRAAVGIVRGLGWTAL